MNFQQAITCIFSFKLLNFITREIYLMKKIFYYNVLNTSRYQLQNYIIKNMEVFIQKDKVNSSDFGHPQLNLHVLPLNVSC